MQLPPILVVDEKPDMLSALCDALGSAGFPVEQAASGSEALDRFKTERYSLVITDEAAAGISGLPVLDSIKKISPQVPVIVTTANGSVQNAVEAMQAGASDYVLKPFSVKDLQKTVKKIIGRPKFNKERKADGKNASRPGAGKEIITADPGLQKMLALARQVAASSATVLIQGESGTGKELLAAHIHWHSRHPEAPYVAVNCAALPDTLAESELFGHEKGAFTGAAGRKIGKFELAGPGTVVLDEISEMSLPLQAKLLRVLQEKEIDRIGGTQPVRVEARVIAISNRDLKAAVAEGKFRQDLYYRINVIPFRLPPLREREGDIVLLAAHFLKKYSLLNGKKNMRISDDAMKALEGQPWSGNVRELENTMERAVLICDQQVILPHHLMLDGCGEAGTVPGTLPAKPGRTVREMEKSLICQTLKEVEDNRSRAAELLGISVRTLRNKLREYKEEAGDAG